METTVHTIAMDAAARALAEREIRIINLKPKARVHTQYRLVIPDGCPQHSELGINPYVQYTLPSGYILMLIWHDKKRHANLLYKPGHTVTAHWLAKAAQTALESQPLVEISEDVSQTAQPEQEEVYISASTLIGHYYITSTTRGVAANWDELEPEARRATQPILQQRQRDWWEPVYARYPNLARVPDEEWAAIWAGEPSNRYPCPEHLRARACWLDKGDI